MNAVLKDDISEFVKSFPLADDIKGRSFLITGATGLIGSTLIHCLLALDNSIRIIAPVRNKKKAETLFDEELERIELIECDILKFDYSSVSEVDYIIHCASPTASRFFVEKPVETFNTIVEGTQRILDYSRLHPVKSFVFLSSLEVYGEILDDSTFVTEETQGYLNPMSVRSSYPMAKRAAENLCCLYANEYSVPVKVARLTQTTGAGVAKDDNRVIVQFARLAATNQDIVMHTTGEAARPYCYTIDSISAILYLLLKGNNGEAYNIANQDTYISARSMAEYLRDNFNNNIKVVLELKENMGYAPVTKLRLSSAKFTALGWSAKYDLHRIFERLIEYLTI